MTPARRLALLVAALVAGASVAVASSASRDPVRVARGRDFQRATGGLGLGTSLSLSPCALGFDPRVEPSCAGGVDPVVGGGDLCTRHRSLLPSP